LKYNELIGCDLMLRILGKPETARIFAGTSTMSSALLRVDKDVGHKVTILGMTCLIMGYLAIPLVLVAGTYMTYKRFMRKEPPENKSDN